jgi:hypothetical protein
MRKRSRETNVSPVRDTKEILQDRRRAPFALSTRRSIIHRPTPQLGKTTERKAKKKAGFFLKVKKKAGIELKWNSQCSLSAQAPTTWGPLGVSVCGSSARWAPPSSQEDRISAPGPHHRSGDPRLGGGGQVKKGKRVLGQVNAGKRIPGSIPEVESPWMVAGLKNCHHRRSPGGCARREGEAHS